MPIPARKSKLSWQLNVLEGVSGFQPFQADLPQGSKKQLDYLKLVVDGLLIQDGLPAYEQFISCSTKNSYTIKLFFPAGMMSKEAVYICQLTWFCQYCVSVHYSFVSDYQTCLQQPMIKRECYYSTFCYYFGVYKTFNRFLNQKGIFKQKKSDHFSRLNINNLPNWLRLMEQNKLDDIKKLNDIQGH